MATNIPVNNEASPAKRPTRFANAAVPEFLIWVRTLNAVNYGFNISVSSDNSI